MKKQILILVLTAFSGIFFAGFGGTAFAKTDKGGKAELKLYEEMVKNKCEDARKMVMNFKRLKNDNSFDYEKLSYEKDAYKKELNGYITLENGLSCMDKNNDCVIKTIEDNKKIKPKEECIDEDGVSLNGINKLKQASVLFVKSARFFEEAEIAYFGTRHLQLESGVKYNKNGQRIGNEGLDEIMANNIITRAGGGFIHSTQESISSIFRGSLIKKANRGLGTFAILYLFILGVKFIMARGDTERLSSLKEQFAWIILGLGVISVAEFVGYDVFDVSNGNDVLEGGSANSFKIKVIEIVRFLEYIAGGLMLINALISGYGLIMGGEEDEAISKEKQFLKSFLMGTGFILLAEVIVRALSFENIQESSEILITEISGLVNFSLSFIGIVATAMLVMAGFYYVISFGDEEQMGRAKKMIIASIAGIVIAFSAYTIIRFLIV